MSASDSAPVPRKNQPFRLYFAYRNDYNDLVTGWSAKNPAAYLSGDGGAFTNSSVYIGTPTEIGSDGIGYVDITAAGMNYDGVVIKLSLDGANTVVLILYPESEGDYRIEPSTIWNYSTRSLTEMVEANVIQVSGVNVSPSDFGLPSGIATTSQLNYWGLILLNNCGAGVG